MRLLKQPKPAGSNQKGNCAGLTLMEVLVATSIGMVLIGGTMMFINNASVSVSGITAQATLNYKAGQAIEFMQSRIQFATSISNDASGNALTLAFDDNYNVDSDGDGKTYNDKDHFERFQFLGVNGTNSSATASNSLIYIPRVGGTSRQVLLQSGVRNLPGFNIFTMTNGTTAVIRFGVVDPYGRDRFQSLDIQATGVSLNRRSSTNVISILP
jgi:Tfp pilus assembly protein PilW